MVRLLKIHIGKNQADEDMLRAIIATIQWNEKLAKQVHVLDDYTYVVFYTDLHQFKLLERVYPDIAGVENVRSEELTKDQVDEAILTEEVLRDLRVQDDEDEPVGGDEGDGNKNGDSKGDDKSDPKK